MMLKTLKSKSIALVFLDLHDSVLETSMGNITRNEKFASKEELCQQIQADIETAKQKFATCCCRIAI